MLIPNQVSVNGSLVVWKFNITKSAGAPCAATVSIPSVPGLTFSSVTSSKNPVTYSLGTLSWGSSFSAGESVEVNITYIVSNTSLLPVDLTADIAFICDTLVTNNTLTETLSVTFVPPVAGANDKIGCVCGNVSFNDTPCTSCTTQYRIVEGSEVNIEFNDFDQDTGAYSAYHVNPNEEASFQYNIWCVDCPDGNDYDTSGPATVTLGPLFLEDLSGETGAQGSQGADGVQGSQGPQGFQGAVGAQGAQGTQGSQGSQGNQGFQGVAGTPGGPQGDQGTQGPQGDPGGPQGFQGTQGTQGPQGTQGLTGAQGTQGVQGDQGSTGAQGPQGNAGSQGAQGSTGAQGATGAQGNQGAQGTQGTQGTTGAQGNQGTQGAQGEGVTAVSETIHLIAGTTTISDGTQNTYFYVVPSILNGKTLSKIGGRILSVLAPTDATTVSINKNGVGIGMDVVLTNTTHNSDTVGAFAVATGDVLEFRTSGTTGTPKGLTIYVEFTL